MDDIKKRGRQPTKVSEQSGGGDSSTSTIPKKRGRPANPDKVKKPPSGRGRGRPAKNAAANKKNVPEGSDDEVNTSIANGGGNKEVVVAPAGRGRPPKHGKPKVSHPIDATGKGRGRPKNPPKSDQDDDDIDEDDIDDDDDDGQSNDYKPSSASNEKKSGGRSANKGKLPKKSGRPKKVANSDDDDDIGSDDDKRDDERRAVGRPSSGAVNLNIVRTGRGQGRPKKAIAVAAKRPAEAANGGVPKKRGRPSTGKGAYVATGKPRGRPKSEAANDSQGDSQNDDDEDDDEGERSAEENNKGKRDRNDDEEDDDDIVANSTGEDERAEDLAAA